MTALASIAAQKRCWCHTRLRRGHFAPARTRARRAPSWSVVAAPALLLSLALAGCTVSHSKQALWVPGQETPSPEATFVSEEDSGLSLLGLLELSEPDHYAVLLERARQRYRCERLLHVQLDFFTDYWLIVAFPISRVTLLCEPKQAAAQKVE